MLEGRKYRHLRSNNKPDELRLIAEMNDITRVALFFHGDAIMRAGFDKTIYFRCVGGTER